MVDLNDYKWDAVDYDCDYDNKMQNITNVKVTSVDIPRIVKRWENKNSSEIEEYCIERIITLLELYKGSNWIIDICDGYYGQEVRRIYMTDEINRQLYTHINKIKSLKIKEKQINYVLELEYGYLLEDLKKKKYSVQTINKKDLVFAQREYTKKISPKDYYFNYKYPRGIVIKEGNKYRLIDGYNRCLSTKSSKIKVIIAE